MPSGLDVASHPHPHTHQHRGPLSGEQKDKGRLTPCWSDQTPFPANTGRNIHQRDITGE